MPIEDFDIQNINENLSKEVQTRAIQRVYKAEEDRAAAQYDIEKQILSDKADELSEQIDPRDAKKNWVDLEAIIC